MMRELVVGLTVGLLFGAAAIAAFPWSLLIPAVMLPATWWLAR